jgi:hypothetical protein
MNSYTSGDICLAKAFSLQGIDDVPLVLGQLMIPHVHSFLGRLDASFSQLTLFFRPGLVLHLVFESMYVGNMGA